MGERAFRAEVTARTTAVRWEEAHPILGTGRRLLQLESDEACRPGLQELVHDPKGNSRL